jgi:hypothetical protein
LALLPFAATGVAERGPRRPRQGRPEGGESDVENTEQDAELDLDDDGDDDTVTED